MTKRIIATIVAALALAGCSDDRTTFDSISEDGIACLDGYSYLIGADGSYAPSPETLGGYEDFDCREGL